MLLANLLTLRKVVVGGVQPQATGSATPVLEYNPDSITAAMGDIVEFHFMQKNHTASQSTFANPCVKMPGGTGPSR
jgi:plastocyanin